MSKPVPREAKPAERLSRARQRQKLIDACITALHQHGPSRTTIDKVVTIADMSPGIVNFYFETKAALLVAALEHLAVEFETLVLEPLAQLRETPMVALDRLIDLYLDPNVASARKVSVWYSFWGESSSRREYFTICGKRDLAFAALVQELTARVIDETRLVHLDADAVALGLIGCLEMMWQEIAFQDEADVDRATAKKRCRAYLRSVFAGRFVGNVAMSPPNARPRDPGGTFEPELTMFRRSWQFACSTSDLPGAGAYVAFDSAIGRVLLLRDHASAITAFVNTCLHRPHRLVSGDSGYLESAFTCPADGAVYGLDGVRRSGGVLQPLRVAVRDAAVFVSHALEPPAEAPEIMPPYLIDRETACSFDIAADWKLVVEHWADAYFDTNARLFGSARQAQFDDRSGPWISQSRTLEGNEGGLFTRLYSALCAPLGTTLERRLIWPNLFVESRPDGMTIRQVLPLAVGRSRVRIRRYGRVAKNRNLRAMSYLVGRIEAMWHKEDVQAVESTLAGDAGQEHGVALSRFLAWTKENF